MTQHFDDRNGISRGVPHFARTAALLASVASASENVAEAVDLFYDSGPITSNNLIGWNPASQPSPLQSFYFQVSDERSFGFMTIEVLAGPLRKYLAFSEYGLNLGTFDMAVNAASRGISSGVQFFDYGQTWASRAGSRNRGIIGILRQSSAPGTVTPEKNVYFLFKFIDGIAPAYGWINADIRVEGNSANGYNYVRINRYAWQSSTLGVLAAGVTPVPEPSTLVTSGIAALAGGAAALRRWRKERKSKTEAA